MKYLRGINLLALKDPENAMAHFMFNAHGDTVQLINGSGGIYKSYSYDSFGNMQNDDANDTNPFRFCAEYWDRETKTVYLRARHYSPRVGRFLSLDTAMDGINWYLYCYNNPILLSDATGMKPYSTNIGMGLINGEYTLYINPQWLDFGSTATGVGFGYVHPLAGVGFSTGQWGANRLAGFRGVDYDISGALSIAASLTEHFSSNPFLKGIGQWGGLTLDTYGYAKDWFFEHNYQIEEALSNHLNHKVWFSNSRDIVDNKFEYAMNETTKMIFEGKIEVQKAVDYFGKYAFSETPGLGMVVYRIDPLTGKYRFYHKDEYYFFMLDDSMLGSFASLEELIQAQK